MAKFSTTVAAVTLLACMFMSAESVLNCGQVASSVAPCLTYLRNAGPLTPTCCAGVSSLNNAARITPDRQAACTCLKTLASNVGGINPALAASLPSNCGVSIPYSISPSIDCTKVN
ncbi:hypothetical protein SAY87_012223 [Trapa incisa]|uniref:Non-specific lipid-transfer protein n=2 Tax=Trapa TaxID=22665 RepID=A0AAN7MFM2_TRANT|nr:hypothetical protein SAY87_012223 [Trapa incisa]KAK4796210.1 hypothetical protein SAY86_028536 [Trapa natans]